MVFVNSVSGRFFVLDILYLQYSVWETLCLLDSVSEIFCVCELALSCGCKGPEATDRMFGLGERAVRCRAVFCNIEQDNTVTALYSVI